VGEDTFYWVSEVTITDVDMTVVDTLSKNKEELSSAYIEEDTFVPDHGAYETSPTAISQEELDLVAGFLYNLCQKHLSSIIAEPTAWTIMHYSPCAPSPLGDERVMI
jgi:hypothetical protein